MTIALQDGARIGIVGGGPAGSLTAYFLLSFARLMEMPIGVDIYEPRDFGMPGPGGCNMCGGIVSESLVQALAIEGIELPTTVVQRGIDSYFLHTDESSTRIDTPLHEMRIAAIHRGGGPRDAKDVRWGGLDGYLLGLARELGANAVKGRVSEIDWDDGRPRIHQKDSAQTYDLLVGATGINSSGWEIYEKLGLEGKRPESTKVYITELSLGSENITRYFGSSMHIFMLDLPRLDCAAMIPKGDFVTLCLLGDEIDRDLINAFFASPAVRRVFPPEYEPGQGACHCQPRINVQEAEKPFTDRVVLVGDCGATRLYKDGIGAAYRTAKAAARTAMFRGVAEADFEAGYWPTYKGIAGDNRYGDFLFKVVHVLKRAQPFIRGVVKMTAHEQKAAEGRARRMSMVLWDMFTGSASYRDIFYRTLDPRFVGGYAVNSGLSLVGRRNGRKG